MLLNCCVGEDSWESLRPQGSILKEISPEYSLEGLMLKLKLWYFGHLMQTAYPLEKTLMLAKNNGRRRGQRWIRWLDGIIYSMDMSLNEPWETVKERETWYATVHGVVKSQTRLGDWTESKGAGWNSTSESFLASNVKHRNCQPSLALPTSYPHLEPLSSWLILQACWISSTNFPSFPFSVLCVCYFLWRLYSLP